MEKLQQLIQAYEGIPNNLYHDREMIRELMKFPFGGIAEYFLREGDYHLRTRFDWTDEGPLFKLDPVSDLRHVDIGDYATQVGTSGPISYGMFLTKEHGAILVGERVFEKSSKMHGDTKTKIILTGLLSGVGNFNEIIERIRGIDYPETPSQEGLRAEEYSGISDILLDSFI